MPLVNVPDDQFDALNLVAAEVIRAQAKHRPYPTAHHGYAVILEELDELWTELKAQEPDQKAALKEAVQVAATAVRFIIDVCGVK